MHALMSAIDYILFVLRKHDKALLNWSPINVKARRPGLGTPIEKQTKKELADLREIPD